MEILKMYQSLNGHERRELYKMIQKEYVVEDVTMLLSDQEADYNEATIDADCIEWVAEAYTSGLYDCNLGYWDNLRGLVDRYTNLKG